MYIWSDITAVQDYKMHYVNAWLKRCVFNLDLNRECAWTPNVIRKAIPEFGSQMWKISTSFSGLWYPRYDQKSRVLRTLGNGLDCSVVEYQFGKQELNHLRQAQIFPWRANLLHSLAPTLFKLTYLWFSNDLEESD